MSTFNLNDAMKSGKLKVRVAACREPGEAAVPEKAPAPVADDCPQCDGLGKEDNANGIPAACRRCGGAGYVERACKVGTVAYDEGIGKIAESDDVGIPNDQPESDDSSPSASPTDDSISFDAPEVGELPPPSKYMSDGQLMAELVSRIGSMDEKEILATFEGICEIAGILAEEKTRRSTGKDGKSDVSATTDFVYEVLGRMKGEQLRLLDAKIGAMG